MAARDAVTASGSDRHQEATREASHGEAGPAFYDDDVVFATYASSRERPDNPNDALEEPVLRELARDLAGRRILDLGCGAGAFGAHALAHGCRAYVGADGSHNMVSAARQTLANTAGAIVHATLEMWDYPVAAFDLVVSSLALQYVADVETIVARVFRTLVPGGQFVFSVEHPVITYCARGWQSGPRQAWLVDDYFVVGPRETSWLGGEVVKYHRTIESSFAALQTAGFVVDRLRESDPQRTRFADEAEYARRTGIPLFLFFAGHRPAFGR